MNRSMCLAGLLTGAVFTLVLPAVAGTPPASESAGKFAPPSMSQVAAFDRETRHMFQYVSHSLVEVHLSRDVSRMLPPPLRRQFAQWEEHWVTEHHFRPMGPRPFDHNGPAITITPDVDHSHHDRQKRDAASWIKRLESHPIGQLFLLQRFLITRLHAFGNPHLMPILQAVHLRIQSYHNGLRNRVYGLVTGHHGHVLVLSLLGVGGRGRKIIVTTPDGRTCRASVLGVDFRHDITELQLPADIHVPGLALANRWPLQAQTVLAVNASAPGIKWTQICGQKHWRRAHFIWKPKSTARGERRPARRIEPARINTFFEMINSPRFFVDIKGRLTAVSTSNTALVAGGKFSILRQFIKTGFASGPQFGIKYRFLPQHSPLRRRYPLISSAPAAAVKMVFPHSPADRAGIKRRDVILTIDAIPINRLRAIIHAARRQPDHIPVTLVRDGKLITLTINLLPPHHRPPPPPMSATAPH